MRAIPPVQDGTEPRAAACDARAHMYEVHAGHDMYDMSDSWLLCTAHARVAGGRRAPWWFPAAPERVTARRCYSATCLAGVLVVMWVFIVLRCVEQDNSSCVQRKLPQLRLNCKMRKLSRNLFSYNDARLPSWLVWLRMIREDPASGMGRCMSSSTSPCESSLAPALAVTYR